MIKQIEKNRQVTIDNISYGMLVEVIREYGGYHAGCKVHFFNKKGVLVGNFYEFLPYERLRLREPYLADPKNPRPTDGKDRSYQRFFMDKPFEKTRRFLFIQILKLTSFLIKWTQKFMD